MQTILVPIDFSPQARNAAIHAAEYAKAFNAKLFLFHAYMLPTPVSEVPYVMVTVDELQKENENELRKEAEWLGTTYKIEVEWLVRIGIPSDEIRNLTEERQIDLVVMGMKGVGGLDKIIGSTTINSIRKVKVPVLIIPQDSRFVPLEHITYATDLHYELVTHSYKLLLTIARHFNASIHIVHVHTHKEQPKVDELEWRRAVEELLGDIEHDFYSIEDNSVMHGINNFIEHHSSQLLVMIPHKHTFFERLFSRSQTTAMAYETRIPLLVLQQKG